MPKTCGTVCEAIVAGSLEFLVLACHSEPCGTWVLTTRKEQCCLLLFGLPYGLDSNSVVECMSSMYLVPGFGPKKLHWLLSWIIWVKCVGAQLGLPGSESACHSLFKNLNLGQV